MAHVLCGAAPWLLWLPVWAALQPWALVLRPCPLANLPFNASASLQPSSSARSWACSPCCPHCPPMQDRTAAPAALGAGPSTSTSSGRSATTQPLLPMVMECYPHKSMLPEDPLQVRTWGAQHGLGAAWPLLHVCFAPLVAWVALRALGNTYLMHRQCACSRPPVVPLPRRK